MTANIKQKALELGYISCGIIPAAAFDAYHQYLSERIRAFPSSKEHYESGYDFVNPPAGAKSIIVCIQSLSHYKTPASLDGRIAKNYLFDVRLPYSDAYRASREFETYLNTCGLRILECDVPDRWAAARAGLGKFGRNNFIYDPDHGSYINVEAFVVDRALDYDAPPESFLLPACKEGCLACVRACPTKALSGAFSMEYGRCITHVGCFEKDLPDETTRAQMGKWLYGCDVCQDVCPANKGKYTEQEDFPLLSEFEPYMELEQLLKMDENTYRNIVNPRFWYMGEDKLWLWKCNALRSMINSGEEKYHALIKECLTHEDTRVRAMAQWGCGVLGIA